MKSFKFIIVGGGGYIGYHIGVSLLEHGHNVTLYDISQPDSYWLDVTGMTEAATDIGDTSWSDGKIIYRKKTASTRDSGSDSASVEAGGDLKYIRGSLLDVEALNTVIKGMECVIHCASYGMSGKEQMPSQWSLTEQVNITGTENVLKACQTQGVRALVYTSSFNVVFGGQHIANGDESLPYFPLHRHEDHYSRTKAIAERVVLFSDNLSIPSHSTSPLRTCALRLAGVMGLGEKRHLPRIVDYFDFMFFTYGYGKNSLQQFVTLRNVVQAHVKAAENLLLNPDRLGGQAYFISDGDPMNTFEFLRPLREALGYEQPKLVIPMWLIWALVYVIKATHTLLWNIHPCLRFPPMLTTAEVYKTAVTHYFSSEKANKDFGYSPQNPNDISDVIRYFCEEKKKKEMSRRYFQNKGAMFFVLVLTLFLFYFISLFF